MSTTSRLLIVHALSSLHVGTGQATAAVDLPIARERATHLPLIPGSSLKGALRACARQAFADKPERITTLFGPEKENASDHAGAVAFSDARLLLLPVRSVAGTFAWVTSPLILRGFFREAQLAGHQTPSVPSVLNSTALVPTSTTLTVQNQIILEEFDLDQKTLDASFSQTLAALLFPDDSSLRIQVGRHLCIVSDTVMSFLATHATELVTRVSIDPDTGTAADGQLWTEENLPNESILYALLEELPVSSNRPEQTGQWLDWISEELFNRPVQIGGKATVGRGRCLLNLLNKGA